MLFPWPTGVPAMGSIRVRPETGKLQFDFIYRGQRCREQTALADTAENRKRVKKMLDRIEAEIMTGTFDYARHFPASKRAAQFAAVTASASPPHLYGGLQSPSTPLFRDFAEQWVSQFGVDWRRTYRKTMRGILERYLLPRFADKEVGRISRDEVLQFRSEIAKLPGRNGNDTLSPKTINDAFGLLSMILSEAADRYHIINPCAGVKRLKIRRTDIAPFALAEVNLILREVRSDYRDYFLVRFFTGMRTGEIHGLKWKYVDLARRQILVRETWTHGHTEYTKTDGSQREIHLSQPVVDALERQASATRAMSDYVFANRDGKPLSTENVTNRVWYPLLRYLGLERRRPYQTRHTAATLWLAAGENPEWIARQLGHSSTEMLFRVYSRYVPNLTRQDGSAFDRMLAAGISGDDTNTGDNNHD